MDVDAPHVIELLVQPFAQLSCNKVKFLTIVYCLQFNVHLGPESPLDER